MKKNLAPGLQSQSPVVKIATLDDKKFAQEAARQSLLVKDEDFDYDAWFLAAELDDEGKALGTSGRQKS